MSPPRTIGQYRIAERLATGGAGEVYAAIDTKVGREVAFKFLRPELASDPSWVDRFLAEAKSLGRLNHPNIATLYTLYQEEERLGMIMELVRGRTVEQIIAERHGGLGTRESLAIVAQAADGLSYAHEEGVIHRDIKPSNLMVTESGRVKIMDFGIARVRGSDRMTRAGSAVGTPLYMSPEQCRGLEGDERSDIYSLAIVLYELLAGAPPFKGATDFELTKAHLGTPPPPLIPRIAGVEPPLESAIMTALSKRPEQRFPSIRSFSDATGATALRGDATGIIKNQARLARGQAGADEPPKRAPLHTVVVALMRSRAAAIARRFKGLHPAVQGVLVSVFAMAIAAAAVLLSPEPGPIPDNPKPGQLESFNGDQDGKQRQIPATPTPAHNDPISPPPNRTQTESASDKRPPAPPRNSSFPLDYVPSDTPDRIQEQQSKAVEQKHPQPAQAESRSDAEKPSFQDFEAAEQQGNYGVAFAIAKKLDAAGDPAGAYGLGDFYVHGYGRVPKDRAIARGFFSRAAEKGFPKAMVKLGLMYYDGIGGEKDKHAARIWFEKTVEEAGDTEATAQANWALGTMCKRNEAKMSPCDAEDYYAKAKAAGYTPDK